jgi:hypothetical protein
MYLVFLKQKMVFIEVVHTLKIYQHAQFNGSTLTGHVIIFVVTG